MTKEEFAAMLNGRQYGEEITKEEEATAKALGYIVAFGASDDLTEFCGALHDEEGAWRGNTHLIGCDHELIRDDGFDCDVAIARGWKPPEIPVIVEVRAQWCPDDFDGSWLITANVPFASFDIFDGNDLYCRGCVFKAPLKE